MILKERFLEYHWFETVGKWLGSVCVWCVDIVCLNCLSYVFRQAAEQARGRAEHEPTQPRGPREEDPHQADER